MNHNTRWNDLMTVLDTADKHNVSLTSLRSSKVWIYHAHDFGVTYSDGIHR